MVEALSYGELRRKLRLGRACKTWFQATLDEAGTKQPSVMYRFALVLESGTFSLVHTSKTQRSKFLL